MSADPDQEYFCDGMTEEIINSLAGLRGLRVTARTSAFAFKGVKTPIDQIGEKLRVQTLLEGSVRKAGNRVRITAQLVDVRDGYHLWSERFDRNLDDVFAIQEEIALAIADKLRFDASEKQALAKQGTSNLEAHDANLASDNVRVLYRDRKSRLWIGTRDGGLNRWDAVTRRAHRGEFRRYTTKDGLPSSVINGILEDDAGLLWISTNRGISKFDPERETFKNYDEDDGLQGDTFQHGAAYRAADGEMFFGGPDGFNRFRPDEIRDNQQAPPVVLRAFLKFNESVDLGQPITDVREIELTHKDYVVAFEFAALDYTEPEKNRYMYRLEGFDEDWIEAGDLRRATYTNLGPREYTFRVKAANSDGVWTDRGLAIQVNVIPPPWRTWWAYMIYGLSVIGIVYAYTRVQAGKLEREAEYNRELELQVAARTEELADRNRELEGFNEKLEEASLTDSLTGSWNRRYLLQQIPTDVAEIDRHLKLEKDGKEDPAKGKSLLFLMFDLDGFKELNDTYGHAAGDRVLIQVRKMFLEVCRQSDIIVRWGGDEFLLVGKNTDPVSAENLAERIRTAIEGTPFDIGLDQKFHLSCSIGFAFYPFDRAPSLPSIAPARRRALSSSDSDRLVLYTGSGQQSTETLDSRPSEAVVRLAEWLKTDPRAFPRRRHVDRKSSRRGSHPARTDPHGSRP